MEKRRLCQIDHPPFWTMHIFEYTNGDIAIEERGEDHTWEQVSLKAADVDQFIATLLGLTTEQAKALRENRRG